MLLKNILISNNSKKNILNKNEFKKIKIMVGNYTNFKINLKEWEYNLINK